MAGRAKSNQILKDIVRPILFARLNVGNLDRMLPAGGDGAAVARLNKDSAAGGIWQMWSVGQEGE